MPFSKPVTRITDYLGTRYEVTRQYSRYGRLLWRNVRLSRGGILTGPAAADLNLAGMWNDFRSRDFYYRHEEFLRYLGTMVRDPGELACLLFCGDCGDPAWPDEMDSGICARCVDDYRHCDACGVLKRADYLTRTLGDSVVCETCRSRYYTYCEECDGYYPDDFAGDHDHYPDDSGDDCCSSPALHFAVRNDGAAPLANNTRAEFSLPAGTISQAGMRAIVMYLQQQGLYQISHSLDLIGDQWQTREGNFAKRLSRYAHKYHGAKLTPEVMSQVGCIARDHSNAVSVEIEVTRDFNQSAAYFYHAESCYWGGYGESRCALKSNGAYAIRSFQRGRLSGRVWVLPLKAHPGYPGEADMVPTFDTMAPDALVAFNGYGDLAGYAAARIVAHMAGWTYRRIGFDCSPMYVNSGGFLVAPEDIAGKYTDGSLYLSVNTHSGLYEREM